MWLFILFFSIDIELLFFHCFFVGLCQPYKFQFQKFTEIVVGTTVPFTYVMSSVIQFEIFNGFIHFLFPTHFISFHEYLCVIVQVLHFEQSHQTCYDLTFSSLLSFSNMPTSNVCGLQVITICQIILHNAKIALVCERKHCSSRKTIDEKKFTVTKLLHEVFYIYGMNYVMIH